MKPFQLSQLRGWIAFLGQYRYVLLMIVVGLVLMLLPTSSEEESPLSMAEPAETATVEAVEVLEERLSAVLSQVTGAGETQVILTLEDSGQRVLAENLEQDDTATTSQAVILSDTERGEAVVELQTVSPTFRGALVVCQGGSDPTVQLELIRAVSVLTGLSSNKIAICTAK